MQLELTEYSPVRVSTTLLPLILCHRVLLRFPFPSKTNRPTAANGPTFLISPVACKAWLPLRLAFEQLVSDALELTLIARTSNAANVKKRFLSDMSNSPFSGGTMLRPLLAEVRMGSPKPSTGILRCELKPVKDARDF